MLERANEEAERNIIKSNSDFHTLMDNRKKDADNRIEQMKNQNSDMKTVNTSNTQIKKLKTEQIKFSFHGFTLRATAE